ncbi:hypothetical protein [Flavobacterium aestivum]|uniref:hypothetical protein n=1 Tax=Flavobacterium aestivum TaxID=3003257 RepID=UPI00228612AE|nr:hypothetical protein [Flavobacterium aestivum]
MKKIIEKYSEMPKNLFKRVFITFLFGYIPFAILHIILNITEVIPVNFNGKEVYGIKGIIILVLFIPFVVLIVSFFVWLYFIFGNLVLRIIKKMFYE